MKSTLLASMLVALAVTACDKKDDAKKDAAASASAQSAKSADSKTTTAAAPAGGSAKAGAATAHLGANCDMVARVDVAGILAAPAIKAQVVPALEEMKTKEPKDDDGKKFKAFLTDAGLDPMNDIKEIAVCVGDAKNAFDSDKSSDPSGAVILAGSIKADKVVPALLKNAKSDKKLTQTDIGGTKAVTDDKGEVVIGQASDGSIVVGFGKKAKEMYEGALKSSDASGKYKIPGDQSISFIVTGDTVKQAMSSGGGDNPFKAQADKVSAAGAAIGVDLKKPGLQLRLAMSDEKAATELAGVIKMLMGQLTKAPAGGSGPDAIAMAMLKDAKIDSKGSDVVIDVAVPADQLDAAAKQAADAIRKGQK